VSTGGERDLGWSRPPTDGRPPSAIRRLGFTDRLDILVPASLRALFPRATPPRQIKNRGQKMSNVAADRRRRGQKTQTSERRQGGRTSGNGGGGPGTRRSPALGLRGSDLRWEWGAAASGWRSGAIGDGTGTGLLVTMLKLVARWTSACW
jgi:hypothetical protein